MPEPNIVELRQPLGTAWQALLTIYHASFPAWEREADEVLSERLRAGRYRIFGIEHQGIIKGFYLLEFNYDADYVLLVFLAVAESMRGLGLGSRLCEDMIARFHREKGFGCNWLITEAEERQARFYGRHGFKRLDLDYEVPRFNEAGTVKMSLMAVSAREGGRLILAQALQTIIRHNFLQGYEVGDSDPRYLNQIARIQGDILLLDWPPAR